MTRSHDSFNALTKHDAVHDSSNRVVDSRRADHAYVNVGDEGEGAPTLSGAAIEGRRSPWSRCRLHRW